METYTLPYMKQIQFSSVAQSCPTLQDPMDGSPPGSSIHGILQARALQWGAIAFSARLPSPPLPPGVCSDSCPLSWLCDLTVSSSATCFCLQSSPASGSFPMSWLFVSGAKVLECQLSISPSSEYSGLISFRTD